MRVYTVHHKPSISDPDKAFALVREGFSWPAAVLTVFWMLWHRMWLAAGLVLAADILLELTLILSGADEVARVACQLGLFAFIGYAAGDWRRAKLAKSGYRDAGVIAAANNDAAFRRFLDLNPDLPLAPAMTPLV